MKSPLFSPLQIRSLVFKNRIFVSPMCQYSSHEGFPTSWHLVHLGSRAIGGAACIIQEATAVVPEGRITPNDAGIWSDAHIDAYRPITQFIKDNGSIPAIQLAHAGRKASVSPPWEGGHSLSPNNGGWAIVGPSSIPIDEKSASPHDLNQQEINNIIQSFNQAAARSLAAGFDVIELHAAHGYLLHEFLSPLSNKRTDRYGGSLENRLRLLLEIASSVRHIWPQHLPVFVRLSASDWVDGGWDVHQSTLLCSQLKEIGIDFIDVSSAGLVPYAKIETGPGFQVPFCSAIRRDTGLLTGAVGMITDPRQAEHIIAAQEADVVLLARELLRDPYWPLHAAHALGVDITWPQQYERAKY